MPKFENFKITRLEKITIILMSACLIVIFVIFGMLLKSIGENGKKNISANKTGDKYETEITGITSGGTEVIYDNYSGEYSVYVNDVFECEFSSFDEAVGYAEKKENASVRRTGGSYRLWDNTPQFNVYKTGSDEFKAFANFGDAAEYAWTLGDSEIFFRNNNSFIWSTYVNIPNEKKIENIPRIGQYPELFRGCEVTSLTMLLRYYGFDVNKMELAERVKKEPMHYTDSSGKKYEGNPANGFVGDIYDENKDGLGVYHEPMYSLLKSYDEKNAADLTGCRFEDLFYFLNKNIPIAVIVNSEYRVLPEESFEYWDTMEGRIRITYDEHSVLVCGYDSSFIYFNDPMKDGKIMRADRESFINAWIQMGRQAVTVYR